MEGLLSIDLAGQNTNYVPTLQKIIQTLDNQSVKYAITGTLALGIYTAPRFTDAIEILCHAEDKANITHWLGISTAATEPSFPSPAGTSINIVIREASITPEILAVDAPSTFPIFGISVPFIKSEYLLWNFLADATLANRANAFGLIDSGNVAMPTFEEILKQHSALDELAQLRQIQSTAHTQRSSYTGSVRTRILRRQSPMPTI